MKLLNFTLYYIDVLDRVAIGWHFSPGLWLVVSSSRVNGHSREDGVLWIEAAGCCSGVEAIGHWTQPDNTALGYTWHAHLFDVFVYHKIDPLMTKIL